MYAVFRETNYPPDLKIQETSAFQKFQEKHSEQSGYIGTMVTNIGDGRHLTVTLWETQKNMDDARMELGPVVEELLNPLMTSPAKLLGTGIVVANDINKIPD